MKSGEIFSNMSKWGVVTKIRKWFTPEIKHRVIDVYNYCDLKE